MSCQASMLKLMFNVIQAQLVIVDIEACVNQVNMVPQLSIDTQPSLMLDAMCILFRILTI